MFDTSGNSIDVQLIAGGYATAWTRDGQLRNVLVGLELIARANRAGCMWQVKASKPAEIYWPVETDFLRTWGEREPWEPLPSGFRGAVDNDTLFQHYVFKLTRN